MSGDMEKDIPFQGHQPREGVCLALDPVACIWGGIGEC